jgi:hypothetical protein
MVLIYTPEEDSLNFLSRKEDQEILKQFTDTMPIRWSATHLCLPDKPQFRIIKALLVMMYISKESRLRTKFYTELLSLETQYQLMSYGIPVHELPLTSGGVIKTKHHIQWIKTRRYIDDVRQAQGCNNYTVIVHPRVNDVLFSRGGNSRHHGNQEFHQMVGSKFDDFNAASNRNDKRAVREEMEKSVRSRNGRFLELNRSGGWWDEIKDAETLHNKISSSFYDYARKIAAAKNQQRHQSDTVKFLGANKRRKFDGGFSFCNGL